MIPFPTNSIHKQSELTDVKAAPCSKPPGKRRVTLVPQEVAQIDSPLTDEKNRAELGRDGGLERDVCVPAITVGAYTVRDDG